jgi:hypothetical protein
VLSLRYAQGEKVLYDIKSASQILGSHLEACGRSLLAFLEASRAIRTKKHGFEQEEGCAIWASLEHIIKLIGRGGIGNAHTNSADSNQDWKGQGRTRHDRLPVFFVIETADAVAVIRTKLVSTSPQNVPKLIPFQ